jgi:hypothetical protein
LCKKGNWRKFFGIVREFAVDLGGDRQDRTISHQEGLAIGWRVDEGNGRYAAVRPCAILYDNRPTQAFQQPTANDSSDRVW